MNKIIMVFFMLVFCLTIFANIDNFTFSSENENLSIYTIDALLEDFEQCYDLIKDYHPDPYAYISEESLDKLFEDYKKLITHNMNSLEFNELITSFVSNVEDVHIWIGMPADEWQNALITSQFIPININIISNEMYISDALNMDLVGYKILSINGIDSHSIIEQITKHFNADGNNKWSKFKRTESNFPLNYMMYIGEYDSYSIEYSNLDGEILSTNLDSVGIMDMEEHISRI